MKLHRAIPGPLRQLLLPVYTKAYEKLPSPPWLHTAGRKYESELGFWRSRFEIDKGNFANAHYEKLVLAIAGEPDASFVRGKVVADFGCGPRGSLVWAEQAQLRIGIDVLATHYFKEFPACLSAHGMIYLQSSEAVIPLPSSFVDVLVTINALDHVENLPVMCAELLRIVKPGGELLASFNLGEPPTPAEPQTLTEELLERLLLSELDVRSYRIAKQGPRSNVYQHLLEGNLEYRAGEPAYLWVRATKPL